MPIIAYYLLYDLFSKPALPSPHPLRRDVGIPVITKPYPFTFRRLINIHTFVIVQFVSGSNIYSISES